MPVTIALTPAQLRLAADALGGGAYAHDAAELRSIADRLERGEAVTVEHPAYTVSYTTP
mgnify:CR=1 FL=1